MTLQTPLDRAASVAQFGNWRFPMWKHADDLLRYAAIIQQTRPDVIVECGTYTGDSACWFNSLGPAVITIDLYCPARRASPGVMYIGGSSVDPRTVGQVRELVDGARVMVSLDSDHSRHHVAREIALYSDLVSPGCHLVVEDGVIAWLDKATIEQHGCGIYTGNVLEAIEDTLPGDPRFGRDLETEGMSPVSMHPTGWWRRRDG